MGASKPLRVCNRVFNVVLAALLVGATLFAGYSLWDNQQVYAEAKGVRDDLLNLRPKEGKDNRKAFEKLRKINPDVVAWITMDGTKIDYPIVQGEDDEEYLNKDVYGDFALSGSIFLDTQCNPSFTDAYSLVYGHHMENHLMFGDLDLYHDKKFFKKNTTGVLMTPNNTYGLEVLAVMTVNSSDSTIFSPTSWAKDCSGVLSYATQKAEHIHSDVAEKIGADTSQERIVALATCSSEGTEARTVLLARIVPYTGDGK